MEKDCFLKLLIFQDKAFFFFFFEVDNMCLCDCNSVLFGSIEACQSGWRDDTSGYQGRAAEVVR